MTRKFVSRAEFYHHDREKAAGVIVGHGQLTQPDGTPENALVLFSQNQIVAVLPVDEAYRLAHDIAGILTDYRKQVNRDEALR